MCHLCPFTPLFTPSTCHRRSCKMGPNVSRQCLCTSISVPSLSERLIHHILSMATLKMTTNMPYTSPTVRIVPILTTPANTVHTRKAEIGNTRDHLQPPNATPSCAARTLDVQNAKDHWLEPSTAKMAPAKRCDLYTTRHENACSVRRADRSRARGERLVDRRALVPVASEDEDADSRKQCSKRLT